jgi:hypothetical protein
MALVPVKYGITGRDARGQVGRTGGYATVATSVVGSYDNTVGLALAAGVALRNMSNMSNIGGYGLLAEVADPSAYGTNAEFPNVEDKARLLYLMSDDTQSSFEIPAPKLVEFLTDGETVDPAGTHLIALTAALTAVGANAEAPTNKAGATYVKFIAGMRVRRRFQRKTTIWTKIPALSGPEE